MRRLASVVLLFWATSSFAQVTTIKHVSGEIWLTAKSVKGLPFSGDVVSEFTKVLPNGDRVVQMGTGKLARDSEGRTRVESLPPPPGSNNDQAGQFEYIMIRDPVKQVSIELKYDAQSKRIGFINHFNHVPGSGRTKGVPEASPYLEDLGTEKIEGIAVHHTRFTQPIQTTGDEPLVVTVEESWLSEELHQFLRWERDDPRYGHMSVKLVNIQRSEPDPSLFRIPPDYK